MIEERFPLSTKKIRISFGCTKCKNHFEYEITAFPQPDYTADTDAQSRVSVSDVVLCENCGKEFNYEIHAGIYSEIILTSQDFPEGTKFHAE